MVSKALPPMSADCGNETHSVWFLPGLLGGHSGLNIGEGRGNAVKMAAETLDAVFKVSSGARLVALRAGDKRNALPREALAMLLVSAAMHFHPGSLTCRSHRHL